MGESELVVVSTRMPKPLVDLMKKFLKDSAYVNVADFLRAAVRDKIRLEAPGLYRQFLVEVEREIEKKLGGK